MSAVGGHGRSSYALAADTGRWFLLDFVAKGGTARVYRARHELGGPIRAVKVLRDRFRNDAEVLKLFAREAEVLRSVSHPNVVRLVEDYTTAFYPYIVSEFVPGRPLAAYCAWKDPVYLDWTLGVLIDVADALGAIHAAGWVHGDIKPSNVIVRSDAHSRACLIDFGVAASVGDTADRLAGTPMFYPPECVNGGKRMPANDLYSLGAVAYLCTTGRAPFGFDSVANVLRRHVEEPVVPPCTINPDIPASLNAVICRLLDKRPDRRGDTFTLIDELTSIRRKLVEDAIRGRGRGQSEMPTPRKMVVPHEWPSHVELPPTVSSPTLSSPTQAGLLSAASGGDG